MGINFLDFEQPIAELEAKIEELRHVTAGSGVNVQDEIARLQGKSEQLTRSIFSKLSPWQITQLARHPQRPYTLDYLSQAFSEFQELHGDRMFGDDQALIGGLARLDGTAVVVIGHQKGRDTKERVRRNYGMPKPEGYRKALRLMRLAERFGLPVITFIDTPGAYPGLDSEERGQSEAIARNLFEMAKLRVPIISVVIGEGGSGGALAIGVCDRSVAMLERAGSVPAAREMALRTRSRSARSARSKPSGSSSAHGLSAACSSRLVREIMTIAPDRASASPSSMRSAPMEPDSARTVRTSAVHFDGPAAHRPSARAATSRNSTRFGMSSTERT